MPLCSVCHDLRKRDVDGPKLACDFTPERLLNAAKLRHCSVCSFVLKGILLYEDGTWTMRDDVSLVYLYAMSKRGDSLTLEIYFRTEKPKLVLEFFHTEGEQYVE
jgi:hypothetical protein